MPNSRVCLTWAVPVDIRQLGPAFEAYATTSPHRNMLRLCNRFGKGTQVAVNKLPAELLQHIEYYMIEDARSGAQCKWEMLMRCFEHRCKVTDHYKDDELKEIFFSVVHICAEVDCEGGCEDLTADHIRQLVEEHVQTEGDPLAMKRHRCMKDLWLDLVGRPGEQDRGVFKEHEQTLQDHFGLEVWTTHAQISQRDDQWADEIASSYSTRSYLCLPGGIKGANSLTQDFHEGWDEDEDGPSTVDHPSENGCEIEVTFPTPPSTKSLARFARAAKILGLSVVTNATSKSAEAEVSSADASNCMPHPEGHPQSPAFQPKQMMLMSNGQDSDYWFEEEGLFM